MSREVTTKLIPTSFELEGTYARLTPENVENGYSDDDSENFATFTVPDTTYRVARYVVDTSSIPEDAEIIDVTGYAKVSINSPNNFANGNASVAIALDGTSFSFPGRPIRNTSAEKLPLFFTTDPYGSVSDMGYKRSDFNNLLVFVGGQKSASVSDGIIYFYGASIEMTYLTNTPEPEPPTPEPPTPDMSHNISVGPVPTDHSVMSGLRTRYSTELSSYYSGGSIVDKFNQLIVYFGGEAHPAATITELLDTLVDYIPAGGGTSSELSVAARSVVSRMLHNLVLTAGASDASVGYLSESDMDTVDNYILNSATDSFIAQLMTALIMDNVSTTESLSVVNQVFEYAGVDYAIPPELLEGGNDSGGK